MHTFAVWCRVVDRVTTVGLSHGMADSNPSGT